MNDLPKLATAKVPGTFDTENVAVTPDLLRKNAPEWNWKKCPGCKSMDLAHIGEPKLYRIDDPQLPARWVIVYGWRCGKSLHGSIVLRGHDVRHSREKLPVLLLDHDYQFIVDLTGREVKILV